MLLRKAFIVAEQFGRLFADQNQVQDDGLLGSLVKQEVVFGHATNLRAGLLGGLQHVVEVICYPAGVLVHTGRASVST